MSISKYDNLVNFREVDNLTYILLSQPARPPKPIFTPIRIKPPRGFEKQAEQAEKGSYND